MSMFTASRSSSPAALPTSEPPRSAAWHAAWQLIDELERLIRDESVGADREALMACVLRMRHVLVRGGAGI